MLQQINVLDFIVVRESEFCDRSVVAQVAGIDEGVIHAVGDYPHNDLHIPYDSNYFYRTSKIPYEGWEDVTPDPIVEKQPIVIPTPPTRKQTDSISKPKRRKNSKYKIALKIVQDNPTLSRVEIRNLFKKQIPGSASDNMCNTYFYKAKKQLMENNNDNNDSTGGV